MTGASEPPAKPVRWIGSSKEDLSAFPADAKLRAGGALWDAQIGLKSPWAKPLNLIATRLERAKEDYEQWRNDRRFL